MSGRLLAIISGVAGLVLVLGFVVYMRTSFTGHPASVPIAPAPSTPSSTVVTERSAPAPAADLVPAPTTSDPAEFARTVATAIFDWDTTNGHGVEQYVARLVDIADPTGEETPGLVADLTAYLPTVTAWSDLRSYSTRQWLEIGSVKVPSLWPQAVAEAPEGALLPGSAAYTVTGVRHRAGVWQGEAVASAHEAAFTIFMVCGPSYDACRLLRLSRLNEPLS